MDKASGSKGGSGPGARQSQIPMPRPQESIEPARVFSDIAAPPASQSTGSKGPRGGLAMNSKIQALDRKWKNAANQAFNFAEAGTSSDSDTSGTTDDDFGLIHSNLSGNEAASSSAGQAKGDKIETPVPIPVPPVLQRSTLVTIDAQNKLAETLKSPRVLPVTTKRKRQSSGNHDARPRPVASDITSGEKSDGPNADIPDLSLGYTERFRKRLLTAADTRSYFFTVGK